MKRFELLEPCNLPLGVDAWFHRLQGRWHRRPALGNALLKESRICTRICTGLSELDHGALETHVIQSKSILHRNPAGGGTHLLQALALIGELAFRILGLRPYTVQFMGALAIHQGRLAEMATGEGKTLTIALAAVLAGWSGRPCHIISVNDYLTTRDAKAMQPLYAACQLSVSSAEGESAPQERQVSYVSDIVYVTAKTLLADYLRDQLTILDGGGENQEQLNCWLNGEEQMGPSRIVLTRGLHTAIIDEADSILIDEAVTPLILSAHQPFAGFHEAVSWAGEVANRLTDGVDYTVDQRTRQIHLSDSANFFMAAIAWKLPPAWCNEIRRQELLRQALTARIFMQEGKQYILREDKVVLLDEFTGRMTPERSLSSGLHQAIEAFQNVPLTNPNVSMGQMSFQTFFRRFSRLSGSTGTAMEAAAELWRIYGLSVIRIPTHRPRRIKTIKPKITATEMEKWSVIAEEVLRLHLIGRPVLIGVRTIIASETLSSVLEAKGLTFDVLNAKQHAMEATIIAGAGQSGRITIATNMAGRGTDIVLDKTSLSIGGLHVIIAECNNSKRIDRQLAGRCGRQGDPGSVFMVVSLQETLFRQNISVSSLRRYRLIQKVFPIAARFLIPGLVLKAQKIFEKGASARRQMIMQSDDWLDSVLPFA